MKTIFNTALILATSSATLLTVSQPLRSWEEIDPTITTEDECWAVPDWNGRALYNDDYSFDACAVNKKYMDWRWCTSNGGEKVVTDNGDWTTSTCCDC